MTKKIAISTGGGDAPGLNAVIRAATLTAINVYGWEVVGIRNGFDGLLEGEESIPLDVGICRGILSAGGTILGAANRGNPFNRSVGQTPDGKTIYEDQSDLVIQRMKDQGIDALIMAGGDGTMAIANKLLAKGIKVVGVPKTIDNDLRGTDRTFGFDTALNIVVEALDRLRTTAESHHRVMLLEVMGRNAGWIALHAGISGGTDVILIPEIPFDMDVVCQKIDEIRYHERRLYSLIVVAEGAAPLGGEQVFHIKGTDEEEGRLGGIAHLVGKEISHRIQVETRVTVLGHIQRGGTPTVMDRWLGSRFGANAVHLVAQEKWGYMVALHGNDIVEVPIAEAIANLNLVDPDSEPIRTARDLGISFGMPAVNNIKTP